MSMFNPKIHERKIVGINKTRTSKGSLKLEFEDSAGMHCSIQKSSIQTFDAILFGVSSNRMFLTRDQVKELLPILQQFVENGEVE